MLLFFFCRSNCVYVHKYSMTSRRKETNIYLFIHSRNVHLSNFSLTFSSYHYLSNVRDTHTPLRWEQESQQSGNKAKQFTKQLPVRLERQRNNTCNGKVGISKKKKKYKHTHTPRRK
ncbi:hypothetical protein, unlikely [Trypanosoma brucei gambiense DAL972]|uniref:Uncharacterized protein n=1 Tax=Trypanosoma brucei gambiense (strain MHOM/CI/86/DAL972) TaxID=679716 RepID=C9ZTJ0_TRYB9|nr:hypothetical protein, unlikely [Trypanosoma brucei gambiense DAL972]CBH12725.1 hypothetical protein, unlikely [Trypanosoma brucei gambiense DAL972]|eukprot:XP_011775005.1 hypothetical protein, unlikely [Trypanosoma brucei gambiense DAL972]